MSYVLQLCMCACMLSGVRLFATPWTVARQAPPPLEFSMQEYWSRLPIPSPGDLSDPGIEPVSLTPPALGGRFFNTRPPGMPDIANMWNLKTKNDTNKLIYKTEIELET